MSNTNDSYTTHWSGKWAFIIAASGSAIGLGNVWKFPYLVAENGGGTFILLYLLALITIATPIMIAELVIGRSQQCSPPCAIAKLVRNETSSPLWEVIAWAGMLTGILILSFYSVIAGWTISYSIRAITGAFYQQNTAAITTIFSDLLSDPERMIAYHTIFCIMVYATVSESIHTGIERMTKIAVPLLMLLLLILVGYAFNNSHFLPAISYLFSIHPQQISTHMILLALGQAFFTLSIGMGAMIAYGAYIQPRESLIQLSMITVTLDTLVALLAGIAIFPILFSQNMVVDVGPGLVFQTLPLAFGHMPSGNIWGGLFFTLLILIAWSSAVSLTEPAIAWLQQRSNIRRADAAGKVIVLVWILGIGTVFSFTPPGMLRITINQYSFFEIVNYATSNVLLPTIALLISLFTGWGISRTTLLQQFPNTPIVLFNSWLFVMRFMIPLAIIGVLLTTTGQLDFLEK